MSTCEAKLYARIQRITALTATAKADGVFDANEMLEIGVSINKAGIEVLEFMQGGSDEEFDCLVQCCERLYWEYVAPIDIKAVPNWLEKTVDNLVASGIRPALQQARNAMKRAA